MTTRRKGDPILRDCVAIIGLTVFLTSVSTAYILQPQVEDNRFYYYCQKAKDVDLGGIFPSTVEVCKQVTEEETRKDD